jgi:hypothetical protein
MHYSYDIFRDRFNWNFRELRIIPSKDYLFFYFYFKKKRKNQKTHVMKDMSGRNQF